MYKVKVVIHMSFQNTYHMHMLSEGYQHEPISVINKIQNGGFTAKLVVWPDSSDGES